MEIKNNKKQNKTSDIELSFNLKQVLVQYRADITFLWHVARIDLYTSISIDK